MKRILIISALVFSMFQILAQNIENSSFDSIYLGGIDRIWNWTTSDGHIIRTNFNQDTVFSLAPNTTYGPAPEVLFNVGFDFTTPYSNVAIVLKSTPQLVKENGQPFETYITNGTHFKTGQDGYIDFSKRGSPFPYRPIKLNGFYRYFDTIPSTLDSGKCMILLKKYNSTLNQIDTIAYVENTIEFTLNSSWAYFDVPINYLSTATPDSIVVAFFATTRPNEASELWVDELSFQYISTSNESFENSESPIIYPNPCSGIINIESNIEFQYYKILDITGCELKKAKFSEQISIEELPNQIFILQLISEDGLINSFRIIKI
ncbi:T9SS type A sorting domain-containing protein [Bacteroidota bacterium]